MQRKEKFMKSIFLEHNIKKNQENAGKEKLQTQTALLNPQTTIPHKQHLMCG